MRVEALRGESNLPADVADGPFDLHQSRPDRLDFAAAQRLVLHSPDGLPLHEFSQQLDEGEDELNHRALDIVRIRIPPKRGLELRAAVLALGPPNIPPPSSVGLRH